MNPIELVGMMAIRAANLRQQLSDTQAALETAQAHVTRLEQQHERDQRYLSELEARIRAHEQRIANLAATIGPQVLRGPDGSKYTTEQRWTRTTTLGNFDAVDARPASDGEGDA
jgi:hypothetical protein